MGTALKEALRSLCAECGFSYAVFWKFASQNPSLLVWEEGHYELLKHAELQDISKIGNTQSLSKEWGVLCNPSNGDFCLPKHHEGGINILVKKMMIPQVHVVGEGIVGRAAFTGIHQWILHEAHFKCGPMSEVQAEVRPQFSAGIQTIAVIPVLPHGVIQLGSAQTVSLYVIMENLGLITHVKSLFVELGHLHASNIRMQVPASLEMPVVANHFGNACGRIAASTPHRGNCDDRQYIKFSHSRLVPQPPCSSLTHLQNTLKDNAITAPIAPRVTDTTVNKSPGGFNQPNSVSAVDPGLPVGVIAKDTDTGIHKTTQNSNVHTSGLGSILPNSARSGVPCCSSMFIEQETPSILGLHVPANNYQPTSLMNKKISQPVSQGCASMSVCESIAASSPVIAALLNRSQPHFYKKDIGTLSLYESGAAALPFTVPFCGMSESPSSTNDIAIVNSILNQCDRRRPADSGPFCLPLEGTTPQSVMDMFHPSKHSNCSISTHFLSGDSLRSDDCSANEKHSGMVEQQKLQKDSFESLENPFAPLKRPISRFGSLSLGSLEDHLINRSKVEGDRNLFYQEKGAIAKECFHAENNVLNRTQHNKLNESYSEATVQHYGGSDLFDILGLDSKIQQCCNSLDDRSLCGADDNNGKTPTESSLCLPQIHMPVCFDSISDGISDSGIFSEYGKDNLLDAVVSKIHSSARRISDDNASCKPTLTASSSSVCDNLTYKGVGVPDQIKRELFGQSQATEKIDLAGSSSFKTMCSVDKTGECSQNDSANKSKISSWVEDGHNMRHGSILSALSKRMGDAGKSNRKRLRPGENPRPRPKDRQMIQDRVKELREIIPNGAKCSIDALLERTIKHMLFLQSVTKHADKLKQVGESKPQNISTDGGLLLKDNFEGCKTLAIEVGSPSIICPIIVEDLNQPRQMRIEMLCEDHGLFLEIAEIIQGLGLTILKGVMESRSGKVWATFVVEANRDVTRMSIFLSLVHLLEQTLKSTSTMPKGFEGGMIGNSIHHQSSVPLMRLTDAFQ